MFIGLWMCVSCIPGVKCFRWMYVGASVLSARVAHVESSHLLSEFRPNLLLMWGFILKVIWEIKFWHISVQCSRNLQHGAAAPIGQVLLFIEASRSYSGTPHSVGILWTSDQHVLERSYWKHTTFSRGRYPCPWRDSKPQSQTHAIYNQ